jgi:hypothetical protein
MFKILTGILLAGLALAGFNLVGGKPLLQPFYTGPLPVLSSPAATPTPTQAPAAPRLLTPTAAASPTATPTACPGDCSTDEGGAGITASPTATPTPAAAPTTVTWTAADCSWAATTLAQDAGLDSAEAAALQAGTDTRYPLSDVPYYRAEAADWTTLAVWIATACASTTAPPASEIAQGEGWLEAAYQSHVADALQNPGDAAWDTQWEQSYQRLIGMLGTAVNDDCADGAACAAA